MFIRGSGPLPARASRWESVWFAKASHYTLEPSVALACYTRTEKKGTRDEKETIFIVRHSEEG